LGRRDAAQQVVAAELDDRDVGRRGLTVEDEAEPLAAGGGSVARNARVYHQRIDPASPQRGLKHLGIALVVFMPVAGEQAVAEGEDAALGPGRDRRRLGRRGGGGRLGVGGRLGAVATSGQDQGRQHDRPPATVHYASLLVRDRSLCHPDGVTSPPAIVARNLRLTLGEGDAAVEILRGIDLAVATGETLALLGPSGSGKSSLMAVLSGLERATSGTVHVAGADFETLDEDS